VSAVEPYLECEWATETIEDAIKEGTGSVSPISEKMDWFEKAVAMMDAEEVVAVEIHVQDWFDEIAEDDDESEDEGAGSGNI